MGECNYYLKARFPSEEAANAAFPRLVKLMTQGEKAYDYWQSSRPGVLGETNDPLPTTEQFWTAFHERFPLVIQYLGDLADSPEWSNGLAGQVGCLVDPTKTRTGDPYSVLTPEGDTLLLKLSGIWHFTEMTRLEQYCRDELGAVVVGSTSDEKMERTEEEHMVLAQGPMEKQHVLDQDCFDAIAMFTGTVEDLDEYLLRGVLRRRCRRAENRIVQARCECGSDRFELYIDDQTRVLRICSSCKLGWAVCDLDHQLEIDGVGEIVCPCMWSECQVAIGFCLAEHPDVEPDGRPEGAVSYLYVAGRCTDCGDCGLYSEWAPNDRFPFEEWEKSV